MKAAEAKRAAEEREAKRPPHAFVLPPSSFTETWRHRPTLDVRVGMRRPSADEYLVARARGVQRADELHPPLAGQHDHPTWLDTYDIVVFHYLLGYALTDPDDMTRPLWGNDHPGYQTLDMFVAGPVSALGADAVSIRFSREGIDRLFFELEALSVKDSPVRRQADDGEIAALAASVAEGTFFSTTRLPPPGRGRGPFTEEEAAVRRAAYEVQMRKFLAYVIDLHDEGYEVARGP